MFIAIGHIAGSILTLLVLGVIAFVIEDWEKERNRKHAYEEAAVKLGVAVDDLENLEKPELAPRLLQYSSERFSSELFRNRISDLCGVIRAAWIWLGVLLQLAVLLGVIWYTFTESFDTAVYAWLMVANYLCFYIAAIGFSLMCYVLTGRYPGEAKLSRKAAAELLRSRGGGKSKPGTDHGFV